MINKILSYLIRIFHIMYLVFSIIGPYIFNDIKILIFLVLVYLFTITQWYLFNSCLLTDIEYKLSNEKKTKYKDGSDKSFMVYFFEKNFNIDEKVLFYIFTLIPVFNSVICLIKIYYLYKSKCKIKNHHF